MIGLGCGQYPDTWYLENMAVKKFFVVEESVEVGIKSILLIKNNRALTTTITTNKCR
jgi:hypothetical protein